MAGHVWRLEFLRRSQIGFSARKSMESPTDVTPKYAQIGFSAKKTRNSQRMAQPNGM